MKYLKLIFLLIVAAAGVLVYLEWKNTKDADHVTMSKSKIKDITPMVRLCSVDIYEDVPIKASIGSRHLFGKTTMNGSISFDLEHISTENRGDTLFVTLPKEIVEVYESTEPESYVVYDTWNDKLLGSSKFTAQEENSIKAKAVDNFRKSLYKRGYVKKARKEAVSNLTSMLESLLGQPVIVSDPTPEGTM